MHLIDFEQLKMENVTLREQIEERGDEVARLRKKTSGTVQASLFSFSSPSSSLERMTGQTLQHRSRQPQLCITCREACTVKRGIC